MEREFGYREIANVEVTHDNITRTLQDWATVMNVPYPAVRMRFKRGKRTFRELFMPVGSAEVHVRSKQEGDKVVVTHQSRTVIDDLFPPEDATRLRDVAQQAGLSPVQVVQKIVAKRLAELIQQTS